ncbi:MAG: pentapeptide repeat-containing protein [Xenococcaceae cyanobacterium MO_188.B32]|nr:pentapeptide repeat-containing protein [Xenococcaceae cyanobacterium MO_188.B32]
MALEAVPIPANSANSNQFDLYLSLNFNQQWYPLLDGRIKLGLKGGQLKLRLENSQLHEISYQLDDYFEITNKASETEPTWIFTLKATKSVLADSLKRVKLGTVKTITQSFTLTATWTVFPADITLTDAEDLWQHDLSPNKHGVLERTIVFFLCKNQLPSSLSWFQLGSSNLETEESWREDKQPEITFPAKEELKQLIQQIYTAKTDEMEELAQLAKLNLKTDLAGGNLLATNLSGIDLNGANLKKANLRGVDLTDADLSEANLSYVNLSGADLSGAYLDNADLSHADLHRTSLAVANLIGANLSHANLQEANLSNANLSLALVERAKFGKNTGLSEEMKLSLEQRGAKETISSE